MKGKNRKVDTNISNVIDGNADKSKYDAEVKKVLSDKQILAWILKYTTKEFSEFPIDKIIVCIEGNPEIGTHPLGSGHYLERMGGLNTEDAVPGEGRVTYDIRFRVVLPGGERIGMIINVEAQKNMNPGYDIVTRGVFYCARMLSSQMGNEVSAKEYDKLQKVYSIWVCLDVPQKLEHSITRYRMIKEEEPRQTDHETRYDLMELVMVYLGREETAGKGTRLHGMLSTVLSDKLKPAEKKSILEQEYEIVTSVNLEGGFVSMCNLSELIEERGIEKGIQKGKLEGIQDGIQKGKLETLVSLINNGSITKEIAANELNVEVEKLEEMFAELEKVH